MGTFQKRFLAAACLLTLFALQAAAADRPQIKPGFNLFSRQQDVDLGRQAAAQTDRQLPIVGDAFLENYINRLGRRLAGYSQAPDFPYTFKMVRDKNINAFALPGGPVYVNTGTTAAADNEAELAGVLAHEISHVALRHATNNASKAMLAQFPLAILGGMTRSGSALSQLARMGLGFGANSVLLKYSRDAERQADLEGARILYDAGYNPDLMAVFFQKLEAKDRGGSIQFLSDHPNPGNRVQAVRQEEARLGPPKPWVNDTEDFQQAKELVSSINQQGGPNRQSGSSRPAPRR
jgi:predicted Zn-dependent protease